MNMNGIFNLLGSRSKQLNQGKIQSLVDKLQQDEYQEQYSTVYKICNDILTKRLTQVEDAIDSKIESNQQNAMLVDKQVCLFYKVAKQLSENLKSTVSSLDKLINQTDKKQEEIGAEVEKRIQRFEAAGRYKDLVESSYFLNIAIQNAKIEMNSVERVLLKKAYDDFNKALTVLMTEENIEIPQPQTN